MTNVAQLVTRFTIPKELNSREKNKTIFGYCIDSFKKWPIELNMRKKMTHKDRLATRLHSEMAEETMLKIDDVVQKKQNHGSAVIRLQ